MWICSNRRLKSTAWRTGYLEIKGYFTKATILIAFKGHSWLVVDKT